MNRIYKDRKWLRTRFLLCILLLLLTICAIGVGSAFVSAQTNLFVRKDPGHTAASPQKTPSKKAGSVNTAPFVVAQQAGAIPASISMSALSSSLATYLTTFGPNAGVEVYDVTRQRSYTYGSTTQFLTGSSIKVPIMFAFFAQTESQEREPDGDEMNLLTAMIENSDNDSASTLYGDIGGAAGLANYLQKIGVSGLIPDSDAWGYSLITPQAMVSLLTQLHDGTILTAADRATALNLLENVETDQQWGVGATAPRGATFAMKDGWLPGPDGLWTVSSSGIVTTRGETYILAVYTREQQSLTAGQAALQHICSGIGSSLHK